MSEIDNKLKLNPKITDVEIGIRELRKITLYPLSVGDQFELTDLITDALQSFYTSVSVNPDDKTFVLFITGLIKKHLGTIFELITCGEEKSTVLKEISNEQLVDIILKIYAQNFECIEKNFKSLSKIIPNKFQSERPFPMSANTMEDTDSNTSSEETSNPEE